jgi:hypothetical protein
MAPHEEHITNISSGGSSAGRLMSVRRGNLVLVSVCDVSWNSQGVSVWRSKILPCPDDLTPDARRVVSFGIRALTNPALETRKTRTTDRPHFALAPGRKPCSRLIHQFHSLLLLNPWLNHGAEMRLRLTSYWHLCSNSWCYSKETAGPETENGPDPCPCGSPNQRVGNNP